jgi:GDP-mannose 6-dehydrogenase
MVALVETLIGKGCEVRVLDRNVSVARLMGANRRYIEEEIPHIASLMCESMETLLAHAEVLVIGNASEEAELALSASRPHHIVVDLTRAHPDSVVKEERRGRCDASGGPILGGEERETSVAG